MMKVAKTTISQSILKLLMLAFFVFLPTILLAQDSTLVYSPLLDVGLENEGGVGGYVNILYYLAIGIGALLAVIKITIAGFKWMLSDVVTDKSQAKKDIRGSLIGLSVVMSAVLILTIINPGLTSVNLELDSVVDKEYVPTSPANTGSPWLENFPTGGSLSLVDSESECSGIWFGNGICKDNSVAQSIESGPIGSTPSGGYSADSFFDSGGNLDGFPPAPGPVSARPDWDFSGADEYRTGSFLHGKVLDWARPSANAGQGRSRIIIGLDNSVLVQPFRTTSNPELAGAINIAEAAGYENVTRRMWISETPGGESITDPRCDHEGVSTLAKISWSQGENRLRCELNTDTNYYLNIQQTARCDSGEDCPFYRSMVTNANDIGDPGASWDRSISGGGGNELPLEINWSSPGGRKTYGVDNDGITLPFQTNGSPDYGGQVNLFEVAGQEAVVRRVSISSSPGTTLPDSMCTREGSGLISIPWIQQSYSGACSLEPNTRYYLEIENVSGCSGSCDAYLTIPTNGLSNGSGDSSRITTCVESSSQKCGAEIDWDSFGPQITEGLRGTNQVISWPFTTTNVSTYKG